MTMHTRNFDLIAFDWDGTLYDSTTIIVRCIQAASARCGAALASATRLHSLALPEFIRCDGTTRPRSLSARYRRRGDCGNLLTW